MISRNIDPEIAALLSAEAVRTRARTLFDLGLQDNLLHFRLAMDKMPELADFVAKTVRTNYPTLAVPFHARWRHFMVDGLDHWQEAQRAKIWQDADEKARAAFDLAIVSVLLDAGAGSQWAYRDQRSGRAIGRSEGLALASLDMFVRGDFSSDPENPLRADAQRLANFSVDDLQKGFQVTSDNLLEGIAGRVDLLNALGRVLLDKPLIFASKDTARPGGLFDLLKVEVEGGKLPATSILRNVLFHLGTIWPSRISLDGVPLGDTWRHPSLMIAGKTSGLVPFHKLSQWLSYSLIEPLIDAGITVFDIDEMTGLAEYRNGGLFVDGGVIVPRDPGILEKAHAPDSTVIVEWRAMTVTLLDELLPLVRNALGSSPGKFPLACMLEGGTWAAGRAMARARRADGSPPLKIISDGTVF